MSETINSALVRPLVELEQIADEMSLCLPNTDAALAAYSKYKLWEKQHASIRKGKASPKTSDKGRAVGSG